MRSKGESSAIPGLTSPLCVGKGMVIHFWGAGLEIEEADPGKTEFLKAGAG